MQCTLRISKFYWKKLFWASSYAVFTVGATTIETVVQYIRNQETPEAVTTASLADNFPA